jgi:DNA invertase Pin-like site-specific DNA recombinase
MREAREKLLEAARRREIDVVLVLAAGPLGPVGNGPAGDTPGTAIHAAEIRKLHCAGVSKYEIARRMQIGRTSVRRILG